MSHPGDLGQANFSNYRRGRLELDVCQRAELMDTHFVEPANSRVHYQCDSSI